MAIFQGENVPFFIQFKDEDEIIISTDDVNDVIAILYNETSRKEYVQWALDPDPSITDPEGLYDRDVNVQDLTAKVDKTGYDFILSSEDSKLLPPGRYIIQVTYNTDDVALVNGKNSIQKGALLSVLKSY